MYKNFNLTESEKEQILNMHKDKGYGKKLREGDDEKYFARHGEGNIPWTGSSNKTYKDLPDGDYDDESYDDFDTLHTTHPEFHSHYSGKGNVDRAKSMFDTYKRSQGPLLVKKRRIQNDQPLNEDFESSEGPNNSELKEPKFEDGDVVHNLERKGQYPWRVVEVYRNFQEVLELNGEGEDTRKLYDSCNGDKEVLNSPFYLLKNASINSKRFAGPDFEYQSEYQMSHWDDQGNGVKIDLSEADWNSPEERERIRMYNETSNGVTMVLQSIDKLFDSINREAYHKCYRAIRNVLKELHDEVNKPQESSVENDDYDERQERNYGVED